MIEEGQSREEIINAGFNEKDVYKVYNLVLKKRIQTLPVVSDAAVVDLSLRINRRLPLTNKYGY